MDRRKYIAEFLGTFTLVFIGAGCVCADSYLVKAGSPGFGLLGIAIQEWLEEKIYHRDSNEEIEE